MVESDPLAGIPPHQGNDSAFDAVLAHWRRRQEQAFRAATQSQPFNPALHASVSSEAVKIQEEPPPPSIVLPDILLQATILTLGDKSKEGQLVEAVAIPWFEIILQLERDPAFMFTVPWRKLEEIIAGAFNRDGYPDVVLTPPSGDGGRDIIATRPGVGSVRIFGQVKAYARGHLVTADETRSMLGVLDGENVSKGLITTTSDFAPRMREDAHLQKFMPYRLELMNGSRLRDWLVGLMAKK